MIKNEVVQFNENHRWCGCLGMITEVKKYHNGETRYMVGIPIPEQGTAYIFVMERDHAIEPIGMAVMVEKEDDI